MRCPKCGYVSFPDIKQCKKCGYRFALPTDRQGRNAPDFPASEGESLLGETPPQPLPSPHSVAPIAEFELPARGSSREDSGTDWAHEISGQVAGYRRRRSNLRRDAENNLSLQFSFDAETESEGPAAPASRLRGGQKIDLTFEDRGSSPGGLKRDSLPLARDLEERRRTPRAALQNASDFVLQADPIDASLNTVERNQDFNVSEPASAPLSRRFLAGVEDAGVLLAAGVLFAALFGLVGGKIHAAPLNFAVVVFLVGFWIFAYFGLFGALTLSTPGQSALGLSVRSLDGDPPTRQESLLRAFGYLVSIASFMLGFLWAAMDSDGLAWHDHISGTMLVEDDSGR